MNLLHCMNVPCRKIRQSPTKFSAEAASSGKGIFGSSKGSRILKTNSDCGICGADSQAFPWSYDSQKHKENSLATIDPPTDSRSFSEGLESTFSLKEVERSREMSSLTLVAMPSQVFEQLLVEVAAVEPEFVAEWGCREEGLSCFYSFVNATGR
jgi:hypothetical protein